MGDALPVDGMDPREAIGCRPSLVALERADQVPFDLRKVGGRLHLGEGLLDIVLPERALPKGVERPDRLRRMRLADGQERNTFRRPPGVAHRPGDTRPPVLPRLLVVEHNRMTPA